VRRAWRVHRLLNRISGGRFLWTPSDKRGWGALRLSTIGRRTGRERSVIIGYLEDGDDLVVLAMNGWGEGQPAWWLNLRARPEATVTLSGGRRRAVVAHEAEGEERSRLWRLWKDIEPDLDRYADGRRTRTPVVVLRAGPDQVQVDAGCS
jgi:deazaflavin-dependent oxidoreductase (nitroreductase family)